MIIFHFEYPIYTVMFGGVGGGCEFKFQRCKNHYSSPIVYLNLKTNIYITTRRLLFAVCWMLLKSMYPCIQCMPSLISIDKQIVYAIWPTHVRIGFKPNVLESCLLNEVFNRSELSRSNIIFSAIFVRGMECYMLKKKKDFSRLT